MGFCTQKYQKARKEHKCEFCKKTIAKWEMYSYEKGVYDGFFTRKLCVTCKDILSKFIRCTEEGEFQWDWVHDWLVENHCDCCQNKDTCETSPNKCGAVRICYGGEKQ